MAAIINREDESGHLDRSQFKQNQDRISWITKEEEL
jgi:hypothetical protein